MEGSVDNDKKKNEGKGGMWALQQKFDQPMDEEASKLKNMYTERVPLSSFYLQSRLKNKNYILTFVVVL
ncbi:putative potassium transporter [Helianthus annuus]|nr:putative potassium transporter [Helianthus annuus]KAJ0707589.1 putative potassium transporter [Helianthus annuus]